MNKQPEQTARTKQTLIDAFWELSKEVGIDKVTISAITKRSGYNRGTFYAYFTDIQDLLAQAEDDMIHDFQYKMKTAIRKDGCIEFETVLNKIVEGFTIYDDKFFLLIGKHGDANFLARIREESADMFRELFDPENQNPYREYFIAYSTSAFTGLLTYWHDSGRNISTQELANILYGLVTKGVLEMLNADTKHL